jgi:tRNA(Ile)-lysidine synthase
MTGIGEAVAAALVPAGQIFVGFSGGLDSTVLLHAAVLADRALAGPGVCALHVNHGLHPDADGWQRHCARLCADLGVPLLARNVDVPRHGSLEAQARAARYGAFVEAVGSGGRLLLAHHRHDQAETVLLRLVQGRGVYGMPRQRPLGGGTLVRPLLDVARQEILDYAQRHALAWLDDPSNADERLDRNFLRLRVLPDLRRRWPAVDDALLGTLQRAHLADGLLAARFGDLAATSAVAVADLAGLDEPDRVEAIRLWLTARGLPVPRRAGIAAFLTQLDAAAHRSPELAVGTWRLRRHRGRVHLVAPPARLQASYAVPASGQLQLPHGRLRLVADPRGFVAHGPVVVRFRCGGERLLCQGRHRSVKHLLQEAAVPPWQRPAYPLLHDALGLLAVPGLAQRDASGEPGGAAPMRAEWLPEVGPGAADVEPGSAR